MIKGRSSGCDIGGIESALAQIPCDVSPILKKISKPKKKRYHMPTDAELGLGMSTGKWPRERGSGNEDFVAAEQVGKKVTIEPEERKKVKKAQQESPKVALLMEESSVGEEETTEAVHMETPVGSLELEEESDVLEETSGGLEEAADVQAEKTPISDGDGNIQNLSDDSGSNSLVGTMSSGLQPPVHRQAHGGGMENQETAGSSSQGGHMWQHST